METRHTLFNFLICDTIQVSKCHGSYSIFDVDTYGYPQLDIVDTYLRSDKVNEDLTVSDTDIFSMEITFVARISIYFHSLLYLRLQRNTFANNQCTTWLNKRGVVFKTFKVCFCCSVDIQMIGIRRCDDGHKRR